MNITLLTIGDELLIGQVLDTNSAWMAKELNVAGFNILRSISIGDDGAQIAWSVNDAMQQSEIVLITGGLGPTKDDITKTVLNNYFGGTLVFNSTVQENIERLFKGRGLRISPVNNSQAMVPDNARIFNNEVGTAPIMCFEKDGKIVISMPGVPMEMQYAMKNDVIPFLKLRFSTPEVIHQTMVVAGFSESALAETLTDWENNLPPVFKLAYLPSPGIVRLRLTARHSDANYIKTLLNKELEKLNAIIGTSVLTWSDEKIEAQVAQLCIDKNITIGTAESCTGGNIAHKLTTIPGASAFFKGSVIAYANQVKTNVLKVNETDLAQHGAVSEQVVEQMVTGLLGLLDCDIAVATSGIAGPTGGTPDKPVGTLWIAVGDKNRIETIRYQSFPNREFNIERFTNLALLHVIKFLKG